MDTATPLLRTDAGRPLTGIEWLASKIAAALLLPATLSCCVGMAMVHSTTKMESYFADLLSTAAVWCEPFCLDCSVPLVYSINYKRKKRIVAGAPEQLTAGAVRQQAQTAPLKQITVELPVPPAYPSVQETSKRV